MSDAPQGPDWWLASDDRWYPPPQPGAREHDAGAGAGTGPGVGTGGGSGSGYESPYNGVPPATPPPAAGQNRTPLIVALGIVVALAVVGIALTTSDGDGGPPDPASAASSTTQGGDTGSSTSAPAGDGEMERPDLSEPTEGGIEVVEQGFSVTLDTPTRTTPYVSFGVVLENTSDRQANGVSVEVDLLDAAGAVIHTERAGSVKVRPGETFGIGSTICLPTTDVLDCATGPEPVDIEVRHRVITWTDPNDEGPITVEGVSTTVDPGASGDEMVTTFEATSPYQEQLGGPTPFAIYRNASGDIVGGDQGYLGFIPPGGTVAGDVTTTYAVADVDATRTEVYVDRGI